MDEKLKILLGDKDIILKDNEDLFININLNRSFFEYKKEKYDNDFDLAKQFEKERNSSRNFRIYGIIESNVIDCDDYTMFIYSDEELTNIVYALNSSSLNFNGSKNIYNKNKGKYYIPLDNFTGNSIYIQIPANNINIDTQVFKQDLVFYDLDNEFISYGTESVEIDNNLNTIEINNNFPFFYNKHWIKKDIQLIETKQAIVSFSSTGQTIEEGQIININIQLDKPSPFGNEKVSFTYDSVNSSAEPVDFLVFCGATTNIFPGTYQLEFSEFEQYKTIAFQALSDFQNEFNENVIFKLDNFISVKSGSNIYNTINILENTPRLYADFIISNMYENRLPLTGHSYSNSTYNIPSIFRNGLFYMGMQNEFYPSDNFNIEIKNTGSKTLLPLNSGLGNTTEQLWNIGEVKSFSVTPSYSGLTLNKVELYLPPVLNNAAGIATNATNLQNSMAKVISSISINGFNLPFVWNSFPITTMPSQSESVCYGALVSFLNGSSADVYNLRGFSKPFSIETNPSAYTITLIANSPGTRLDVLTDVDNGTYGSVFSDGTIATATTIVDYLFSEQIPFKFTLLGNYNQNFDASYEFVFKKNGYRNLTINSPATANVIPFINYLITSYDNVLRNWDTVRQEPILFSGDPIQNNFPNNIYDLPIGKIYYEGVAFLNISNPQTLRVNLTEYGNANNVTAHGWSTFPLIKIPETYTKISTQTKPQKGLFRVGTSDTLSVYDFEHFSFNFTNGNSVSPVTVFWNTANATQVTTAAVFDNINNSVPLRISGSGIDTRNFLGFKNELDLGGNFNTLVYSNPLGTSNQGVWGIINIPVGPLDTTFPGYSIYPTDSGEYLPYNSTSPVNNNISYTTPSNHTMILEAKTPGVPFVIDNISVSNTSVGFTTGLIIYVPILANEIDGVTINPYNNLMGGYSVTDQGLFTFELEVTFDSEVYVVPQGSTQEVEIFLNAASIFGNESVTISSNGNAVIGVDYLIDPSSDIFVQQGAPLVINWAVGEQIKKIKFNNISTQTSNKSIFLQLYNWVNVGNAGDTALISIQPPPQPILKKVSFEYANYTIFTNESVTVKISLDSPSTLGTESVTVKKSATNGGATLGTHYTEAQTLPFNLTWAIGEQDKFITFTNITTSITPYRYLALLFDNRVNVDLDFGNNISSRVRLNW